MLEDQGVYQIGCYGCWRLRGIAGSIREGLVAGSSFCPSPAGAPARADPRHIA